ncbi:hypothetical protein DYU05_04415 [Mucilaginibacter terrenus]|uniref:Uncharacterized protein n=1 Tax=Mucilaginibacter terrenus TaxID=2482727 RepID=A0A3E2NV76_9SPHI|nr:hypothetical protein [Mucilaginibacter terrenus]RFZ84857.1 hypothetical protein DYU05_04415 [Mucilaginibacter terrenus]
MKRLLFVLLLFLTTLCYGQQFGGNPPSLKWKQVNTPQAKVIFPKGLDSTAMLVANIISSFAPVVQPTLGNKQKQVSIVLQNQTTTSNAYVGLAPFRSEFYLMPSQNSFELGSLNWPAQLAIHEYRHVQQYNNFNVGLSHVLRVLFGQGGQALGNELSIPNWFFEGDAVYNETLVSQQGRGRLPYFFSGYRAIWAAGRNYTWMKLRNGSYRDFIPDHYPLGYMMVAYGREKYGSDFWGKVTHDAAAFNTGLYPLQHAVKTYTGLKYDQFRIAAFDHFKKQFAADPLLPTLKNKHFTGNEEYPAFVNDSTLVFVRSTYDDIPKFIIHTGAKERALAVQHINNDNYFTYNNGQIIYAGYRPDPRWGYRTYSELVVLDLSTGKEHRITRKTRYYSAAFSADNKKIIAVDVSTLGKSTLHVLNANGTLQQAVPNPGGLFYTYPKFYGDKKVLTAVRNQKGQMSLALININTGSAKYLLPFSYEPIGFPTVFKDAVYYTKTIGKEDNLYVTSLTDGRTAMLEPGKNKFIGAYQPAVTSGKLAWVGMTATGFKIQEEQRGELLTGTIAKQQLNNISIDALNTDTAANRIAAVVTSPLLVTRYSKAHNLFNFHSLFPTINDPNYSIALVGDNVINTFTSELSLAYNRDEGYKRVGYTATYGGLYPFISAGANYTLDRKGFYKGSNIFYNETDLHAGLQVPLDFTVGKTSTFLNFGSSVYYTQSRFQEAYRTLFADRHYTYLSNFISFSNQIQKARKNINPRFAQSVTITYKNAIAGLNANQFLASGSLYLPGLSINHSLVLSGAHQQSGKNNGIGFSNNFPFSKGYTAENLDNMNKFSASYHFPIAYPDAGFGNLYYLLRLRGYLFYDHTHATDGSFLLNGKPFNTNFRSAGAALFFDGKVFNQGAVSFGIRYSYLLDPDLFGGNGRNRIELVLPVSIF